MKKLLLSLSLALVAAPAVMHAGDFTVNSVSQVKYVKAGKAFALCANVTNGTDEKITSVEFTAEVEGWAPYTLTQSLNAAEQIPSGRSTELYLTLSPIDIAGNHTVNVTISKVNNIDLTANNTFTSKFEALFSSDQIDAEDSQFSYGINGPSTDYSSGITFKNVMPSDTYFRWDLAIVITPETAPELVGKYITGIEILPSAYNPTNNMTDWGNIRLFCSEIDQNNMPDLNNQYESMNMTKWDENGLFKQAFAKPILFNEKSLAFGASLDYIGGIWGNQVKPTYQYYGSSIEGPEDNLYRNPASNGWQSFDEKFQYWKENFSRTTAQRIILSYSADNATGIEDIATEENVAVYYDLQGRKVQNPQSGLFIKKQGNKATKVIL